jgi:hypothetical protein
MNTAKAACRSAKEKVMGWLKRYQEFVGWTPLIVLGALAAWIVFGALDPRLGPDRLGLLLDLPILAAYAFAASGIAYLAWRRWSKRLTEEQLARYWDGLLRGDRGPMLVFAVNALFYLSGLVLAFAFFWPAR